jgi:hypothetical protein
MNAPHVPAPQAAEPPPRARQLAIAGLVPFVLGALLIWLVWPEVQPHVTLALSGYAATVIAFLGGTHWGIAMRADAVGPRAFGWAVVPPLVASVAVIMPAYAGLVVHGVMLLVCYGQDRKLYAAHGYGHWLTLRFRLTAVAAMSCFLGAAGT